MSSEKRNELGVFFHMLYELNKGLRNLALLTTTEENRELIEERLEKCGYKWLTEELKSKHRAIVTMRTVSGCINSFSKTGHLARIAGQFFLCFTKFIF